jgi:hypothetical protein
MRKKLPTMVDVLGLADALCRDIFGPHADGNMLPDGVPNKHGVQVEFRQAEKKIRFYFVTTDDIRVTVLFNVQKFVKKKEKYIEQIDIEVKQAIEERRGGSQIILPSPGVDAGANMEIIH